MLAMFPATYREQAVGPDGIAMTHMRIFEERSDRLVQGQHSAPQRESIAQHIYAEWKPKSGNIAFVRVNWQFTARLITSCSPHKPYG